MDIQLTIKEFRHLLDLVYIGNWILNSTRGNDRFEDYDLLQEKFFALASQNGLAELAQSYYGHVFPSRAYEDGGILAEELARRDMSEEHLNPNDLSELTARMDSYMNEFEINGIENISLNS